jgi:pimeloyl-ACP methyl ester carboxylesterase
VTRRSVSTVAAALALVAAAACGSDPSTAPTTTTTPPTTVAATTPETEPATTTTDTEPDSTEPDSTEPDSTDPDATEPDTTDPDATDPDATDPAPSPTVDPTAEAFQWSSLEEGVEEGFLDVPLDHADPDGEKVSLYVVRHRAADPAKRIGSLLVNPGGPGFGGSVLAASAEFIYSKDLLDSFDIVGWDPRGTGESEPFIDCVDEYDPHVGIETGADTPEEEQALREAAATFAQGCIERSGELLANVSTADAARDMDAIREALQEDEISYFGWSYGTQLGATWATLFPDTVRAAVLDGAINPTTGRVQGLVDQGEGFNSTLSLFLADCAADTTCAFHNGGDTEGAFDALLASLEANPIPTEPGRPPLVDGVFELGVAQALYAEEMWPQLAEALAAAQAGDGSGILALYDQYYGRGPDGTYGNELEAYFVITCADDPPVGGVDAAIAERAKFEAVTRVGYTQAYELVICASFGDAFANEEPVEITGAGAGPIMVVGNTGDPATPYEGSRTMAETLEEGFFVSVEANTHTAYSINECAAAAIDAYLIELEVPEGELVCAAQS